MISEDKERLCEIIIQHTSIFNNLWSVYAATTAVLLGLSIAGLNTEGEVLSHVEFWVRLSVTLGFLLFARGNYVLILYSNEVLASSSKALLRLARPPDKSSDQPAIEISKGYFSIWGVRTIHFGIDFSVLAALWVPML